MRQINQTTAPGITELFVRAFDDANRDVPITATLLDRWVFRIDDGDPSSGGLNIRAWTPGCKIFSCRQPMPPDGGQIEAGIALEFEPSASNFPPSGKRDPLGPFPAGSYDRVLPFTPPPTRDLLFYRGNFCGIRLPGAPGVLDGPNATVPGGDTSLIMTCLLDRYPLEWQQEFFKAYGAAGYTHLQLSVGHAAYFGTSRDAYIALAKRAQSYGLFVDHWFLGGGPPDRSGPFQTRDQDVTYWQPLLDPWIDALLAEKAIDAACVGWQLDQYNVPGPPIQSIIDYHADRLAPHGIPIGTHWVNEAGGWWVAPGNRFTWWQDQRNKLTWFHHQGDVNLSIPEYQAKLCDTLNPFGDGAMGTSGLFGDRPFSLVVYECSAQNQYDGVTSELEGDERGYLLSCTHAASSVGGYGNGARMPDGGYV